MVCSTVHCFPIACVTAAAVMLSGCAPALQSGPPPQPPAGCQPEQVQVLILGTFHFAQQDQIDILSPERQTEIEGLLTGLAEFSPDRVAVEFPYARNEQLNESYQTYLQAHEGSITSPNETGQVGFRLARRLSHQRVYGVDVPMNLWHDSIQVFQDRYPDARQRLRRQWSVRYPDGPNTVAEASIAEILRNWNTDPLPAMPEYGLNMPLVEGDIYAGALKLRAWYDRNLRIVQNFFRVLQPGDNRLFMIVGASHVPVLRHIIDMTPQLCAVDPLPYILRR